MKLWPENDYLLVDDYKEYEFVGHTAKTLINLKAITRIIIEGGFITLNNLTVKVNEADLKRILHALDIE